MLSIPSERSWTSLENQQKVCTDEKANATRRQNQTAEEINPNSLRDPWSALSAKNRFKNIFSQTATACPAIKTWRSSTPVASLTRLAVTWSYWWPRSKMPSLYSGSMAVYDPSTRICRKGLPGKYAMHKDIHKTNFNIIRRIEVFSRKERRNSEDALLISSGWRSDVATVHGTNCSPI